MLIDGMEALDVTCNGTVLNKVTMEDSLFPYISENYHHYMTSGHDIPGHCKDQLSPTATENSDMEADMPRSQLDLTEADVYTQLEHKERDLILAAELGKSLLEKNEELTLENERVNREYLERLEVLEQEKHELRQRLDFKTSECEANSVQFGHDIKRAHEDLEESKAMVSSVEREKSRAVRELSEQNQKLLCQLHRASEAEVQLSKQVQELRKEFFERKTSTNVRILQLDTLNEEIERDSEERAKLETNFDAMKDETLLLRDELAVANENAHHLERQLHDKERELKRVEVELNDAHMSNRQLQVRIDELREEMSLQMSMNSHGNSSLLAELEQSGVDCYDVLSSSSMKSQFSNDDSDKLKQEMWEVYQRVQSVCTVLRTFVNQCPTPEEDNGAPDDDDNHVTQPMNLTTALSDLSTLVQEAISTKGSPDSYKIEILKEKQETLMKERDDAVASKNNLEVSLASAKVDLMAVNSQLLEAIQQKLQQQKELEAWQDDMEQMIQKALVDRNALKRATIVRHVPPTEEEEPPPRSWLPFRASRRRRENPDSQSGPSGVNRSNPTSPRAQPKQVTSSESQDKPGIFLSWLKRRQNPEADGNAPS